MRFMYIVTPVHATPPTPELMSAVHKLAEREIKAGRMINSGALQPRALGAQVRITDGKLGVVDGPFVEAKEVIGGYAIFEALSREHAIELTRRFLRVHGDEWEIECEVRELGGCTEPAAAA
jgi:hypothetical protein